MQFNYFQERYHDERVRMMNGSDFLFDLCFQNQNVHVTYLSSDTDEDSIIVVDRRKQNFVDEPSKL